MSVFVSNQNDNPDRALWQVLAANAAAATTGGVVGYLLLDPWHFSAAQSIWAGVLGGSALVWIGVAIVGVALVVRDAFRLPEPVREQATVEVTERREGLISNPEREDLIITPSGLHAAAWNDESEFHAREIEPPVASNVRRRHLASKPPVRNEELVNSV